MVKEHLRTERIFLFISLFAIMIISSFWGKAKQGMFVDEIYSYGLANGYYTPFVKDIPKDKKLVNNILTQEDLEKYIFVSKDDAFSFDSVYYNQTQDVHPPLYYMLLHFISSIFLGSSSKWLGLCINLILYFCTNLILYKLGCQILKNKKFSVCTVLVYGLSLGGLSTVLMIRMYSLLTFLTVCFAYCVIRLYKKEKFILYPLISLILFMGMFTQYYFVIFSFFISAIYCINKLKKREYKYIIRYVIFTFMGLLCFYFVWPSIIDHLFADRLVSGTSAVHNLFDVKYIIRNIYTFIWLIVRANKLILMVMMVFLILLVTQLKSTIKSWVQSFAEKDSAAIIIALSVLLTVILVAIISPVQELRYLYNVLPMFVLVIIYFIEAVWYNTNFFINIREKLQRGNCKILLCMVIVMIVVVAAVISEPRYIYAEHKEYNRIIEEHKELPCVYMDDNFAAPITQDLLQIKKFRNIFVTNDFLGNETEAYLNSFNNNGEVILYIDVDKFWSSGFDSKEILNSILENTEYREYELLYKYGLTETYLLKKH